MAAESETIVVITDANVAINLFHIGQLTLFGLLRPYRFRIPSEVLAEIIDPAQKAAVTACIEAGDIVEIAVNDMASLSLFADLRDVMGRGEAACLALATTGGFYIASDEKKRFRRRAIELIGEARILRTEHLLIEAIRRNYITVEDADRYKDMLATNSYALPFVSFAEVL